MFVVFKLFEKQQTRVHFQTVFEKIPHPGPGPGWTGARAQDQGPNRARYFFENSLKMDLFFQGGCKPLLRLPEHHNCGLIK